MHGAFAFIVAVPTLGGVYSVSSTNICQNDLLRLKLEQLALSDPDYWSFRGNAKRDHGHGLMQYPAMMVPQMVRVLLREICNAEADIKKVGDPFVGSGTVLTETTLRGLDFYGRDINPLAVLLCRVKAGPVYPEALVERSELLLARVSADRRTSVEAKFDGINKWFSFDVQQALSRIRRAIRAETALWARRFFWVALAETVRLSSNSRTSTFKLHIRTDESISERDVDAQSTFGKVLQSNLMRFASLGLALRRDGYLTRGHLTGHVSVVLGDARNVMGDAESPENACDLIVTSPPYGDNATTVPYGQYSYLPLQWIDLCDIDVDAEADFLRSTHEIDRRSLGGSRRIDASTTDALRARSPSLARTLDDLSGEPNDRASRVVAFVRDLDACIPNVSNMLRSAGVMVWVLGNRRVGGRSVPLDEILCDLLRASGACLVSEIRRRIPSKRMAVRNSVAETMANETILVFRKAGTHGEIPVEFPDASASGASVSLAWASRRVTLQAGQRNAGPTCVADGLGGVVFGEASAAPPGRNVIADPNHGLRRLGPPAPVATFRSPRWGLCKHRDELNTVAEPSRLCVVPNSGETPLPLSLSCKCTHLRKILHEPLLYRHREEKDIRVIRGWSPGVHDRISGVAIGLNRHSEQQRGISVCQRRNRARPTPAAFESGDASLRSA